MAERKIVYPTGDPSGMEFIGGRWVFTGGSGYRVQFVGPPADDPDSDRTWAVYSYTGPHSTPAWYDEKTRRMTEDDAHAFAARLARTTPHPKPTEV